MQTLDHLLQEKFIGVDELRRELTKILDNLPKRGGEIVITQHGKPQAMLIDLKYYLELQEQLSDYNPKLIAKVNRALKSAKIGNKVTTSRVFDNLGI